MSIAQPLRHNPERAVRCVNCGFTAWCAQPEHTPIVFDDVAPLVVHRHLVPYGVYLHIAGAVLDFVYVITSGFLKSVVPSEDGRDQVAGIAMVGDLVALEAIHARTHQCNWVALVDSQVCGMRYVDFERLSLKHPPLQRRFHQAMSLEQNRRLEAVLCRGKSGADQRVACFLADFSSKLLGLGYSGSRFGLPISRADIASYLGITPESVSRALAHFRQLGVLRVNNKNIDIVDLQELSRIAGM